MARLKKKSLEETYRHERGWGYEIWIENRSEYCGKILHVKKGKRGSLHFHMNKAETMFVEEGAIELILVDPETGGEYKETLFAGDSIFIPRGQVHQIVGIGELNNVIEFSTTHEEDDSFRVKKGD